MGSLQDLERQEALSFSDGEQLNDNHLSYIAMPFLILR